MAEARSDETEPLLTQTDDDDDAAPTDGNVSMGFTPGDPRANSTPAPRHTRMNTPGERPSFDYLLPDPPGLSTTTTFAETQLAKWYPKYDKNKILVVMENNTLKARLFSGKKLESLFIYDKSAKKYRLNGNIEKSPNFKEALGPSQLDSLPVEIKKSDGRYLDK